jgi:hypothetical protein
LWLIRPEDSSAIHKYIPLYLCFVISKG